MIGDRAGTVSPSPRQAVRPWIRQQPPSWPLMEAKLEAPTARLGTVGRTRVVSRLLAQPAPPVVTLIAPPGYGKTTVLAQWAARESRPVAWLTLDDLDNDRVLLVRYLVAALTRVGPIDPSIAKGHVASRDRILGAAIPRLVSDVYGWNRPALLVLDDVHRIEDRTCLDALTALLDHLPPNLRVAIAGRGEPGPRSPACAPAATCWRSARTNSPSISRRPPSSPAPRAASWTPTTSSSSIGGRRAGRSASISRPWPAAVRGARTASPSRSRAATGTSRRTSCPS
jgi:hypothetical protein